MHLAYYGTDAGRAFLRGQSLWLLTTAALMLAVFGATDVDRAMASAFYDTAQREFPLTDVWILKGVLHDAARDASTLGWLAVLAASCMAFWSKRPSLLRLHRHELAFVAAALLAAASAVGALKHFSTHACPWDVTEFGGLAAYRPLFEAATEAMSVPGCMPAAHPLVGYAWLCVGLALYPASRAGARTAWLAAGTLGTVFGFVQMARGAHFLSHVLWSAWVTWALELALLAAWAAATSPREPCTSPSSA
jgi:membrane-associated PAP2 superfamily phosphatase